MAGTTTITILITDLVDSTRLLQYGPAVADQFRRAHVASARAAITRHGGLEVLAVYIEARRRLLFDRFLEFWAEQERIGTWTRLERSVSAHLRVVKERRRAAKQAERRRQKLVAAD